MCSSKSSVRIGQTFPMGEPPRTRNPQSIEGCTTDSNSIRSSTTVQIQRFRHSSGYCIGTLRGVIKPFGSHWSNIREATLHLVSHGKGCEEILARSLCIFACG